MIHPPDDTGFACCDDGIALILIAESTTNVIKLVVDLGNPGSDRPDAALSWRQPGLSPARQAIPSGTSTKSSNATSIVAGAWRVSYPMWITVSGRNRYPGTRRFRGAGPFRMRPEVS